MAAVAQLVRALVCGSGGRGFESHQPPQQHTNQKNANIIRVFCLSLWRDLQ